MTLRGEEKRFGSIGGDRSLARSSVLGVMENGSPDGTGSGKGEVR